MSLSSQAEAAAEDSENVNMWRVRMSRCQHQWDVLPRGVELGEAPFCTPRG